MAFSTVRSISVEVQYVRDCYFPEVHGRQSELYSPELHSRCVDALYGLLSRPQLTQVCSLSLFYEMGDEVVRDFSTWPMFHTITSLSCYRSLLVSAFAGDRAHSLLPPLINILRIIVTPSHHCDLHGDRLCLTSDSLERIL